MKLEPDFIRLIPSEGVGSSMSMTGLKRGSVQLTSRSFLHDIRMSKQKYTGDFTNTLSSVGPNKIYKITEYPGRS